MPDDFTNAAPFISPTYDPSVFEGIDWTGVPATGQYGPVLSDAVGQAVNPSANPISVTDVSKFTDQYQTQVMKMLKDLQSQSSFSGPGTSDIQTLHNILTPRTATVAQAPGMSPGLQTAYDVQREQQMKDIEFQLQKKLMGERSALDVQRAGQIGDIKLQLQKKLMEQLFGGGDDPLIKRIMASISGLFGGGTSEPPAGQNLAVGNIVKAMQALNADNAQKEREALTNRFAELGRSPASTVMGDLQDRIARSQSLANIQGAGEIERLMLPIQQQRERIAAEFTQQRERIMESFIQNLLSQVLGGSFGLAGNVGG